MTAAAPAPLAASVCPAQIVALAESEMAEFAEFRRVNPSLRVLTGGPYLVVDRSLAATRHQTPTQGASAVAHACGLAAEVLAGFLARRPEFRDLDCSALQNVVVNFLSISAMRVER